MLRDRPGSPRCPGRGRRRASMAASTSLARPSHTGLTICDAPRRRWMSTASRSMPHTSFWCWSQAPLPTRTGREFRQPVRWSSVCSVRSLRPSMPYMICRLKSPSDPRHRLEHEGEVLERLPVEAEPVERAQHERGVADPGVAVVPVARPAGRLGQRGRGRRHDGAGGGVAQTLEGERAALDVARARDGRGTCRWTASPASRRRCRRAGAAPPRGRRALARPRQGDEGGLALLERRAAVAAGPDRAETDARRHAEHGVTGRRAHRHRLVAVAVVVPHPGLDRPYSKTGTTLTTTSTWPSMQVASRSRVPVGGGVAGGAAVVGSPCPVRRRAARRGGPGRAATPSGCARSSRAPWFRARSVDGAAPGCPLDRTGSCRPCGPGGRRRRSVSPGGGGRATRRSRPARRDSCSRSRRGIRSRRSGETSPIQRLQLRLLACARC